VWKYLLLWATDAGLMLCMVDRFVVNFLAQSSPVPSSENPIEFAYRTAQQASTLTDRALWLFFLGVILAIAYAVDRQKSKQLQELRKWQLDKNEQLISALTRAEEVMERLERKLDK
jgi:hypothetical protein